MGRALPAPRPASQPPAHPCRGRAHSRGQNTAVRDAPGRDCTEGPALPCPSEISSGDSEPRGAESAGRTPPPILVRASPLFPAQGTPLPCTRPLAATIRAPPAPQAGTEGQELRSRSYPGRSPILRSASQRTAAGPDRVQEFGTRSWDRGQIPSCGAHTHPRWHGCRS